MTEFTGAALYVAFKGTPLEGDYRTFSASDEIGLVDASAGADAARTYLATLEDGTAQLELLMQGDGTAATAPYVLCDKGESGTLEWGPEGTAAGKPRRYVTAIVKSRDEALVYNDVTKLTVNFQFSGAVTVTTYSA